MRFRNLMIAAVAMLGIGLRTLYRKIKQYSI